MTETEQLEHAFAGQVRCQAILTTTRERCHRNATQRLHVQCVTPGCHDERMFLCYTCTGYVTYANATCITCGQLPVITGTA